MASSISPVARIWLSAPSNSHGQNAAVGHGTASPVAASTMAKNTIENGKPNRKRILVAPQVPSGPVNCRCIALRATCPSAAVTVNGIQSVAMLIMWEGFGWSAENRGHRAGRGCCGQPKRRHDRIANRAVVPAKAGTHHHRRQLLRKYLPQQIAEIAPFKIFPLDQLNLPVTFPTF